MIDAKSVVNACRAQVTRLESDLRARVEGDTSIQGPLHLEWQDAFDAKRTGQTFDAWLGDRLTQVAVAWVLGCVFVRFCEDNGLIEEARIAGAGVRADEASTRYARYFGEFPGHGDRDYLKHALAEAAGLPGLREVLDAKHNPLWLLDPSADGATALLRFFRATDPATGALALDFTDGTWDTRFLGDLYQDLSESARDRYALLQTPVFVEEFILDRTLTPAIATFGLANTTLIDPTCGSGHFLLGAFDRLIHEWMQREPGTGLRLLVQRALDQVSGVDLNPFAVAIARFRLLVSALKVAEERTLRNAPDFTTKLAVGDSLLFGRREQIGKTGQLSAMEGTLHASSEHFYATEDADALREILDRRYSAVVGNPPYIVVRDKALNQAYREKFETCHRQYSLAVPFMERFFELAAPGGQGRSAGYVGQITANSFMKREFGKKLVEQYLPRIDLSHVIDTSGAYIPGHGTPTVILFGRNQAPTSSVVRTVMGIRGEPATPQDPAKGVVWTSICALVDSPHGSSAFVSTSDVERKRLAEHPWSIGGGGAAELKVELELGCQRLERVVAVIGSSVVTREDDVFLISANVGRRSGIPPQQLRLLVLGEDLRDFAIHQATTAIWPYDPETLDAVSVQSIVRFEWPWRQQLSSRVAFGKSQLERGLQWFEYSMFFKDRSRTPMSIAFAFVATHNHFVLDRGGKVFNRTAPVIKLPADASVEDHLGLLGLLNSSTACFWMKEVFFNKGSTTDSRGARTSGNDEWDNAFEFDSSKLQSFPLPGQPWPVDAAQELDRLAVELSAAQPSAVCERAVPLRQVLDGAAAHETLFRAQMIGVQEEMDWECLRLYGVVTDDLTAWAAGIEAPPLSLGERAFEIVLARAVANGDEHTAWFARHRSVPITELPDHWSPEYRALVDRRIEMITTNRDVALIERPECKRRWSIDPWADREKAALRTWLADRLEQHDLWFDDGQPRLLSVSRLADRMALDEDFVNVARLYVGQTDVRLVDVIAALVADDAVPLQSACRYKDTGRRKRRQWERTWDLQRAEDRSEAVGIIAVPEKYLPADFAKSSYWKLRGKLDVPKERFVQLAFSERANDPSMVVGWAGWDHLQQALALASYLVDRQDRDAWGAAESLPTLVAISELLPWVVQWHPDVDPMVGQPMGGYLSNFVQETANQFRLTSADIASWEPSVTVARGRKPKAAITSSTAD